MTIVHFAPEWFRAIDVSPGGGVRPSVSPPGSMKPISRRQEIGRIAPGFIEQAEALMPTLNLTSSPKIYKIAVKWLSARQRINRFNARMSANADLLMKRAAENLRRITSA